MEISLGLIELPEEKVSVSLNNFLPDCGLILREFRWGFIRHKGQRLAASLLPCQNFCFEHPETPFPIFIFLKLLRPTISDL